MSFVTQLLLWKHDFEDDRKIKVEESPYNLSIRVQNISIKFERKKWCDDFASYFFQKLKATERYRLMLVDDLQVKLEEFVSLMKVWLTIITDNLLLELLQSSYGDLPGFKS